MVAIKDMDMPESCYVCPMVQTNPNVFGNDPHCMATGEHCEAYWNKKRPHWCPLEYYVRIRMSMPASCCDCPMVRTGEDRECNSFEAECAVTSMPCEPDWRENRPSWCKIVEIVKTRPER